MFDVTGNFTMHGQTREVTLPMKKLGEGPGPFGKYRCGFFCQTTLNRSDFGMTNMIPNIGDEVAVTISFEGIREGGDAGSGTAPDAGSAPQPAAPGSTQNDAGSAQKDQGSAPKESGSETKSDGSGAK